jgi:hypothetical protein
METKHIIALIVLVALSSGCILLTAFSQRLRDLAFFAMASLAVIADRFDVNFHGEYWYRGTSRGIGFSLIDVLALAVLVATLVNPRYPRRPWFMPASLGLFALYGAWCAFSLTQAAQPAFAAWELVNIPRAMLMMLATAAFVTTRRELAILIVALGCAVGGEVLIAVRQRLIGGMVRPSGTLDHANSLSMFLCLVTPVLIAAALANFPRLVRWFAGLCAGTAVCGVMLTISRAGLPTFIFVTLGTVIACTTWRLNRSKILLGGLVVMVIGTMLASSWQFWGARYGQSTLAKEYLQVSGENRGVYWRWAALMVRDHPLGIGLNNWSYAVSKHYDAQLGFDYADYDAIDADPQLADLPSTNYAPPAHGLGALTLGELGVPGLVLFTLLWARWFHVGAWFLRDRFERDPMHRIGLGILFSTAGIFLQSITEWTYRQPGMLLTFHALLGTVASLYHVKHRAPVAVQAAKPVVELHHSVAVTAAHNES